MAGESVNIPITLEVTDISTGQIDISEVEKSLSQKISGITKNVGKLMGEVDTSKFNKALESSFSSLEGSYDKLQAAQARHNDALRKAGESSADYKAKIAEIDGAIKGLKDGISMWTSSFPGAEQSPAVLALIKEAEQEMAKLEASKPSPLDFVSSGSETALAKVSQTFQGVLKAMAGVEQKQNDWNSALKENRASDEYMKMAQEVQNAEQKLKGLQEKAAKMQALGATDNQWASLVYDAEQLSKVITENESKMRKMVNTGKAFRFGEGGAAKGQEFMKLTGVLSRVQKSMQSINSMKPNTMYSKEYIKQTKELEALERKLQSYKDKYQKMNATGASASQWKNFTAEASILEGKITDVIAKLQEMVNTGSAFRLGTGDAGAETQALSDRLDGVKASFAEMSNAPKGSGKSVVQLATTIKKFSESAKKGLSNVISKFKQMGKSSSRASNDVGKSLKKLLKNIIKFGFGVRSMYFLVKRLRTTFIESFKNMAAQIPEVNADVSSFMTSLNQLKGSFVTAFQPIVSAIIPWLNRLCAVINTALNAIGKFFATLTGQGYIYEFTSDNIDCAESMDKNAKAAKNAQKALMGFDEINRLDDNSDSGSDSGGGAQGTWNKTPIEESTSSLAELIKKCWEQEDFTELGTFLGEKLKTGLDTATAAIEGKILTMGTKIAKAIATTINGFVSVDGLANSIGSMVGAAINTAMSILNTFLTTTNWLDVGQFIADTINGFITKTDFGLIGTTVGNLVLAAINLFWKTVSNINFTEIGTKISEAINNVFATLGAKDMTGLSGWQKLGQGLSKAVRGLLGTIITALQNIDWAQVGTAIGEFFGSIDWGGIIWDLGTLVSSFISGLCQAFKSWAETDPLSAAIAGVLGAAILGIKVIPHIMELVSWVQKLAPHMEKISTVLTNIGGWLSKAFTAVKTFLTSTGGGIMLVITGTVTAVTSFFDMLKNGFSWLKEILMVIGIALAAVGAVILGAPAAVAAVVAAIVAAVMTAIVLIKEHWEEIKEFFINLWNAIKTKVIEIWTSIKEFFSGIADAIVTKWNEFKSAVSNIVESIKNFFAEKWEAIKTAVTNAVTSVKETVTNIFTAVKDFISNAWNKVKETTSAIWEGIKTAVANAITAVKDKITQIIESVKSFLTTAWENVKTIIVNVWENIKSAISNAINSVKTTLTNILNNIKELWTNAWNAVKTKLSEIWEKLKTLVSTAITAIKDKISSILTAIKDKFTNIFNAVKEKVSSIFTAIKEKVSTVITAVKDKISTILTAIKDKFTSIFDAVKEKVTAVFNKVKEFISTTITAIKETISKILTAIKDNFTKIFDAVKEKVSKVFNTIKDTVSKVITSVKDTISKVLTSIKDTFTKIFDAVKDKISKVFTTIKDTVSKAINSVKDTLSKVVNSIKDTWTKAWDAVSTKVKNIWNTVKTNVSSAINSVKTTLSNATSSIKSTWNSAWDSIKSKVTGIWDGIKNAIKSSMNGIIGFINRMLSAIASGINTAINALNRLSITVPSWVPGIGGSRWGFNLSTVSAPQIPYLAQGAVIPPNKEFMAVLGDQKHGTNIEAPLSTIQEAVATVMDDQLDALMAGFEAVVAAINNKDMTVAIGDKEIGLAANRFNRRQAIVRG